jgi:hypothetical protein
MLVFCAEPVTLVNGIAIEARETKLNAMTDSQEGWESEYLYIPGYVAYTNYVG